VSHALLSRGPLELPSTRKLDSFLDKTILTSRPTLVHRDGFLLVLQVRLHRVAASAFVRREESSEVQEGDSRKKMRTTSVRREEGSKRMTTGMRASSSGGMKAEKWSRGEEMLRRKEEEDNWSFRRTIRLVHLWARSKLHN